MSEDVRERVAEVLADMDVAGLVQVSFDLDDYYDVLRGLVESRGERPTVLVSASMPQKLLLGTLEGLGTNVEGIRVIDCISLCLLGERQGEAIFVESPALMENVLMSLELVHREMGESLLVIVDSFNAFSLHNDMRSMSAFLQILSHRLRSAGDLGLLLSLKEQATEESESMLRLLSERTLEL